MFLWNSKLNQVRGKREREREDSSDRQRRVSGHSRGVALAPFTANDIFVCPHGMSI